jgi:hypothetical protein
MRTPRRRLERVDDVRRLRLAEVCPIHRQPQREAEVANAAVLEQHRLDAVSDSGNLDQWISRGTLTGSKASLCGHPA